MGESAGITVNLGGHEYRVVEQRLGRIERKLRVIFEVFGSGDIEGAAGVDTATLHEALRVFIPDLMPEWEFRGYPSEAAFERVKAGEPREGDHGDADTDHSPTVPEIIAACEAVYTVNGGDRLARFFGKFVKPEVLKATISARLADWAAGPEVAAATISPPSSSLPSPNGGSTPTTSTTRVPISPDAGS